MRRAKRILALFVALTVFTALLSGCKDTGGNGTIVNKGKNINTETVKIMYIPLSAKGLTNKMAEYSFRETIKYYPNISVTCVDSDYNIQKQVEYVEMAIEQKYDAIMIEAMDPVKTKEPIERAEAAGIPVITFDINTQAVHTLHIQGNDYDSGYEAGTILGQALGGSGNVLLFDGPEEQTETNRMCTGFQKAVEELYPDIEILDHGYTDWGPETAYAVMKNFLEKYPEIDGIYCASDEIVTGVLQALTEAGREDGVLLYGSIGYPIALQRIKEGTQYGTYFSDGCIKYSTALLMAMYFIQNGISSGSEGYIETPVISMPTTPVTIENVDNIIEISHWKDADPDSWN